MFTSDGTNELEASVSGVFVLVWAVVIFLFACEMFLGWKVA